MDELLRGTCISAATARIQGAPRSAIQDIEHASSILKEAFWMDVNERLARRIKALREERALSIEHLADRSGVSRAMISVIERAGSSPTLTVLNKLSHGLGLLLPELFDDRGYRAPRLRLRQPVSSRSNQPVYGGESAGYQRRTLTPEGAYSPLRLSELVLRVSSHLTLDDSGAGCCRQLWMLEGEARCMLAVTCRVLSQGAQRSDSHR